MIASALLALAAAVTPDWKAIEAAAERYWAQPTAENASHLWALLPNYRASGPDLPIPSEDEWYQPWSHSPNVFPKLYALLECIEPEYLKGRSAEIRLAFRLLHNTEASFSEDLRALLGGLARTRPELFLKEIAALQSEFPDQDLTELAGWVSPDLGGLQTQELRGRRRALQSVSVPQYLTLRDRCLKQVDLAIQEGATDSQGP